jgi:hypothetical protein
MHRGASPEDNASMSVAVGKKSTARDRVVMRSNKLPIGRIEESKLADVVVRLDAGLRLPRPPPAIHA